ncbi:hypothetical protein [Promicromonospora kroppenstedtii]|uniref:hypothetical protein n=1 Tax=Promicromonospora kroppenstedtii TaxID=440482 RepID=UPI0004AE39E3|nr:hypothetical protein [Promicromonospora kroppenstedtii]
MTSTPARDVDRPEPTPPGRVMRVSVLTIAVAFLAAAVAPTTAFPRTGDLPERDGACGAPGA